MRIRRAVLVVLLLAAPALAKDPVDLSDAVEPIVESLRKGTRSDFMAASLALKFLPRELIGALREKGTPLLLVGLRSDDEIVRGIAASMLGDVKATKARPDLAKATKDPSGYVRTFAIEALWEVSGGAEKPALPHVVRLLEDPDWLVRQAALGVAGEMKGSAADLAAPVGRALAAEDRKLEKEKPDDVFRLRRTALEVLLGMGPKAAPAKEAIAAALENDFVEIRTLAARALGAIGEGARSEEKALAGALADEIPEVRRAAAAALGGIGPVERSTARALRGALDGEDRDFVLLAIAALGRMGEHGALAVPALRGVLRHGDLARRLAVAKALGEIGPAAKSAAPVLEKLAEDDPDAAVRAAAAAALGKIRAE